MPKIIEGLKRLKVLEKRIAGVCPDITKYAAILSNQKPAFETEAEQAKQIVSMLQSAEDLQTEYSKLKRDIDYTNTMVKTEIGGKFFTISELMTIKRKMAKQMLDLYRALNTNSLGRGPAVSQGQEAPKIIQLYDEKMKNGKLAYWQDLQDNCDARLEILNAVTDLLKAPEAVLANTLPAALPEPLGLCS